MTPYGGSEAISRPLLVEIGLIPAFWELQQQWFSQQSGQQRELSYDYTETELQQQQPQSRQQYERQQRLLGPLCAFYAWTPPLFLIL